MVLRYGMDTPQECFPSFQIISLDIRILGIQRDVGCDVDRRVTSGLVLIACRQCCGINVQKVEHGFDGDLRVKFLKHQNRLRVIGVEPDAVSATVIGDAANILNGMFPENAPGLTGTGGTKQIMDLHFPELAAERFTFQIIRS